MTTAKEIAALGQGKTVSYVYESNDSAYPFIFIDDISLGWGEYLDFSNFDPFKMMGFKTRTVSFELDTEAEDFEERQGKLYYDLLSGEGKLSVLLDEYNHTRDGE